MALLTRPRGRVGERRLNRRLPGELTPRDDERMVAEVDDGGRAAVLP